MFVNGGTGGVGSMVVQMAKAVGATVITTVGTDEKADAARELGADRVLNYKADDFADRLKGADGRERYPRLVRNAAAQRSGPHD